MNKFAIGCGGLVVILLVIALVVGLFFMGTYNRLVGLGQGVDAQWAQVQTVYQRRADLIPNLVNTVAGAANFEKSTLTEVTNARAKQIQHHRSRIQCRGAQFPDEFDRGNVWLCASAVF